MFAKEIMMYVDYFEEQVANCSYSHKEIRTLKEFKKNLEADMSLCLKIAQKQPYQGENLESIAICVEQQRVRLQSICRGFEKEN
jgi:hypothetical protein